MVVQPGTASSGPSDARADFEKFYKPLDSTEDRFPDVRGSLRFNLFLDIYAFKRGATVKFGRLSSSGVLEPLRKRSRYNQRRQESVVKKYTKSILESGLLGHMRGKANLVETSVTDEYEILAGAALCEALFIAHQMQPNNKYVQAAMQEGLSNAIIMNRGNVRRLSSSATRE